MSHPEDNVTKSKIGPEEDGSFSDYDVRTLTLLVKNTPLIYDKTNLNYSTTSYKKRAWQEMFNLLKDSYTRIGRERARVVRAVSGWEFYEDLAWIEGHFGNSRSDVSRCSSDKTAENGLFSI
uniref:MADF domain-containing protein n=1 Tax=Rhabditophanes sp. KR3021 TaxID=114890 RepID=A0AC35U1C1_9BILA